MVMLRMGGSNYNYRTAPNCKVCQSRLRRQIEECLAAGHAYGLIIQALDLTQEDLTVRNVRSHVNNGHLPTEEAAARFAIEARAEQMGRQIEDGMESLLDGVSVAQVVLQKGFQAIARGELKPDMKDVLAAAKLVETFGGTPDNGMDQADYLESFMIFHEEASKIMPPEMFESFGRRLSANPGLRVLVAKAEGRTPRPEDAEAQAALTKKVDNKG